MRHPQYVGFTVIMVGLLLQWPTLLTFVMFPILVWMYMKVTRREERDTMAEFGEAYERYAAATLAFVPRLFRDRRPLESDIITKGGHA